MIFIITFVMSISDKYIMKTETELLFEIETITDDIEIDDGSDCAPYVCNKSVINERVLEWHNKNIPDGVFILSDVTNLPVAIFYTQKEADNFYQTHFINTGNRLSINNYTVDTL